MLTNNTKGFKTIQFSTSTGRGNELTAESCKEVMREHV